ncbi:mannose-6-phosphate isomerase-like protein (cupin superfamily) [Pontibacter aydingkolensis]|uniref:Phosphoheptose isomerase n=1 Tax=Pontibacter aydingkolensis TaxID=1911536 RepID=A0ABS7CRR0_9BACT|nr:phosphoheptose isomerase [Pontibacter aydingkolensis]MBW7466537.1 phosphoheptose isomerase [Pontibacter aydingkolensis]
MMSLVEDKQTLFSEVEKDISSQGFTIENKDLSRPWGGFFVIAEEQAPRFAEVYFSQVPVEDLKIAGKLSPKILVVAPDKRLSWQYHHRRAEIWKVLQGEVGVVVSDTDEEGELQKLTPDNMITLKQGERHRLVGLNDWGVLAEIWRHTDAQQPSDEEDIVRVQDDFGR